MKKIIIVLLFVTSFCMLGAGVYFLETSDNKKVNNKEEKTEYKLSKDEVLDNCIDENDCPTIKKDLYANISINSNIKEVQNAVDLINKETAEYYKKAKNSKISGTSCTANKSKFSRGFRVNTQYYIYENDNYIQVGVERKLQDLCTETYEFKKVEAYIYDKNKKKTLTQDELKKNENITNAILDKCVLNDIELKRTEGVTVVPSKDYSDYAIYYTTIGQKMVSYYDTNSKQYRTSLC